MDRNDVVIGKIVFDPNTRVISVRDDWDSADVLYRAPTITVDRAWVERLRAAATAYFTYLAANVPDSLDEHAEVMRLIGLRPGDLAPLP